MRSHPPISRQPVLHEHVRGGTPTFYLTSRQPIHPGILLLALFLAVAAIGSILYALGHSRHQWRNSRDTRSGASGATASSSANDDDDDPNQIDTIVLGDPTDAPRPAHRGDHVSPVHPTILINLPREGKLTGTIPDTPTGRLLYNWLAAFNHASPSELRAALPSVAPDATTAAQLEVRRETGGFNLLSAKDAAPDVMVFRMRDQTRGIEVLGTLQVLAGSSPPEIASFSLRAVEALPQASAK